MTTRVSWGLAGLALTASLITFSGTARAQTPGAPVSDAEVVWWDERAGGSRGRPPSWDRGRLF